VIITYNLHTNCFTAHKLLSHSNFVKVSVKPRLLYRCLYYCLQKK